jgi:hypothetical protein
LREKLTENENVMGSTAIPRTVQAARELADVPLKACAMTTAAGAAGVAPVPNCEEAASNARRLASEIPDRSHCALSTVVYRSP